MTKAIVERIKKQREARGWSRAELARQANMNPATVGLIEAGRLIPYPSQVAKLAAALGLEDADHESA